VIVKEDTIYSVVFRFRDNTLRIGDLVLLWGKPDDSKYDDFDQFSWAHRNAIVVVTPSTDNLSYTLPVRIIALGYSRMAQIRAL
jgi:hypothetical protein